MQTRFQTFLLNWRPFLAWLGLALAIFLPAVWTLPDYGVTYDEPIYMEDSWRVREWLRLPLGEMLAPAQVSRHWHAPSRNVHPAGIVWVHALAQSWVFWEKDPYLQVRTLCLWLYAAALAVFGLWFFEGRAGPAFLFALLSAAMPRLFAHSHFATPDLLLIAGFTLSLALLERSLPTRWFWLGGPLLGLVLSVKFTALLLLSPLVAALFFLWPENWRVKLARLGLVVALAGATFYAVNPGWWFGPLEQARAFIHISTTRHTWAPYSVFFLGKLYDYRGPFYSPAVILLITTPVLHLGLAVIGAVALLRRRTALTVRPLAAGFFAIWPVLLMMWPGSPTNDMERYLLPALPFLACLAVLGIRRVAELRPARLQDWTGSGRWWLGLALLLVGLAGEAGWSSFAYHPVELSYFNRLVGGLPGAHRLGFEDSYWWDAFNDRALAELNGRCRGEPVYFPLAPTDLYFRHMIRLGKLEFLPTRDPARARFVLIYGRPSVRFWEDRLECLRQSAELCWERTILGIPLLRLYSIQPLAARPPLIPGIPPPPPR